MSPTARALLALETIQNNPGITAQQLGGRLGVTERAARRYVAILREADLPIESASGPYGGYQVGRGLRLPPLTFTAAEAMGLVMAVLEGHPNAADPADLVGSALAKIVRVLPEPVAGPVRAFRAAAPAPSDGCLVSPELIARLIESCTAARRLRLVYRMATDHVMQVDPWAVVLRHSRWYLLCWSHARSARRVLRVDRIVSAEPLPDTFTPPPDLDALGTLEEHLSQSWTYQVDVLVDASVKETSRWLPRSLGRLEPDDAGRTRLRASTDDPDWYARRLAAIPVPFQVLASPELRTATAALGGRLLAAGARRPALDPVRRSGHEDARHGAHATGVATACDNGPMTDQRDAIVIGGGHNGLVAAAYLARAGLDTLVLERRGVIGGASVSEHPFGPEWTVTSLSYVLSLLPPEITRDLRLDRHGLTIYPQGPYFAPRLDGRALRLPDDPGQRHAEIAKFSARDADVYDDYEKHLDRLGTLLGPLMHEIPPRLGSHRAADLLAQARLAAQLRKIDVRDAVDVTRLLSGSIADLLDRYFESDAMRGVLSVSGVIGTWAGPRSAGTAYVMLHHHIGEAGGQAGAWGFPRGGMGAVATAIASAARSFGATIRTSAEAAKIRTDNGQVAGVTLASGEEIDAATVVTTAHPKISFLRLIEPEELPAGFAADIENWQTRSGTVKINLALDRLPAFAAYPDPDPEVYGGTIVLSESLDDVEDAFQQAVAGRPSALPFADICIPSVFDDSLAPAGKHVMSLFTQWVPHTYADAPDAAELEAYAGRVIARVDAVAPGFADSVLHRQVIGPDLMQEEYGLVGGNIFHGELSVGQMFHARPAAGYADLRTPVKGLYQAGSATHGGGGVTGIPGRNVVRQILADRRAARWRQRVSAVRAGGMAGRSLRLAAARRPAPTSSAPSLTRLTGESGG